jgi:AAHS family 4-hydroxybenzoate transporter-like MFS transporter
MAHHLPASHAKSPLQQRLDEMPIRRVHLRVFALCGLVALLDGIDNQSIGVVAPALAKDVGISTTSLGIVFSVSQVGATLGALGFGPFADRFGRKTTTVIAVAAIALFTYLTAISPSFASLLFVRFVAGVALAGAIPSVLALGSEYAPLRLRGTIVSVIFAGYPLGAAFGGFIAAYVLAHHDWRWVFYIGAILPFIALLLILAYLPESIRFLAARGSNRERLQRLLRELGIEASASELEQSAAVPTAAGGKRGVPIGLLFSNGLLASTILLWTIYFFAYATTKIMVVWLPTLLKNGGFNLSDAALAQASFNLGCTVGMAIAGRLVDRFGPALALAPALMLGAISVAALGPAGQSFTLAMIAAAAIGFFIGIGGSGAHSIAATIYPTSIRSTGIGWGMAASRMGQVVSPMLVATMITRGSDTTHIYLVLAAMPVLAGLAALQFGLMRRASTNADEVGAGRLGGEPAHVGAGSHRA